MKKNNPPKLRQSSYNVVIPLSSQILESSKSVYLVCNPLYGNASTIDERKHEILREFPEIQKDKAAADLEDERLPLFVKSRM